jgi:hypothetical protein
MKITESILKKVIIEEIKIIKEVKRPGAGRTAAEIKVDVRKAGKAHGKSAEVIKKVIDMIDGIESSGKEYDRSPEYVMRTIHDKLPKWAIKHPTAMHGPEKSGPKSMDEVAEKTPEEKELSLEQQRALKNAAQQLNGKQYQIKDLYYNVDAEYLKKDPITEKPRHVKGSINFAGEGYNFEINYDANTKQYTVNLAGLTKEGTNVTKIIKDLTMEAEKNGVPTVNIKLKMHTPSTRMSSGDWEGGERDPGYSATARDIYGPSASGGKTIVSTVKKANKWGGRW